MLPLNLSVVENNTHVFMGVKIKVIGDSKLMTALRDMPVLNSHCKKTIHALCFLRYLQFFSFST